MRTCMLGIGLVFRVDVPGGHRIRSESRNTAPEPLVSFLCFQSFSVREPDDVRALSLMRTNMNAEKCGNLVVLFIGNERERATRPPLQRAHAIVIQNQSMGSTIRHSLPVRAETPVLRLIATNRTA